MWCPLRTALSACAVCGAPATCLGSYEDAANESYACDVCCGHGNEDGHCEEIAQAEGVRFAHGAGCMEPACRWPNEPCRGDAWRRLR